MLSLDERERRAKERAELRRRREAGELKNKELTGLVPSEQPAAAALEVMKGPVSPSGKGGFAPPKPGESLFDNYANLADPVAFSTDEEEVEELLRMGVGITRGYDDERHREANWDPSPHKNPPAYLKQLKPMTREPWTIDAAVYNAEFDTSDFGKPTRYGIDPDPPLGKYREDDGKRPKGVSKPWNAQVFRQVPYALRGIKPASTATEPWVEDQKNRRGDFEDEDVIENETAIELDNGGEAGFKNFKNPPGIIGGVEIEPWDHSTKTW